jgi:3-hydroxyisobutyrate dehydrogenase/2-hydroxy-3-oxopropionate reductase
MNKIGFVGVGIMGKSMVRNLMKKGFEVHIYARNVEKVEDVINEGAILHNSIKACVVGRDAIITIVGYPHDVEEVYFDKGNILDSADQGTYLIDMTTSSPILAKKIYEKAMEKGMYSLDAPVTGGDLGARNGTLAIMVGGRRKDYEVCLPIFEAMGANINHLGEAGSGQHCKLGNQILVATALSGVCEAFTYAKSKGLDLEVFMKAVSTGSGASRQLDMLGQKIIDEDYKPGFYLQHIVKDLQLALIEANMEELNLEVFSQILANFQELEQEGYGKLGTQALIKYYESTD